MTLDTPNSQGVTRRQSLESAKRQLAAVKTADQLETMFAELIPAPIPPCTSNLLSAFKQLSSRRTYVKAAPQPITFQEIDAFNRLTAAFLTPWEIDTLCSMDGVYINTWYEVRDGSGHTGQ